MANIKVGDVAILKTSGEPCFILEIGKSEAGREVLGPEVAVRRPIEASTGIAHNNDFFYLAELETSDERAARLRQQFAVIAGGQSESFDPEASLQSLN